MGNTDEIDEPTPEEVAAVHRILEAESNRKAKLETHDYDGLLGLPPEWVPKPIIQRFRQARDRVLDKWGYTTEQAVEWLDRYCSIGEEDDRWFYPGEYPSGRILDTQNFKDMIGTLANIRWCISLGPEEGLKEMVGDIAAQGYAMRVGSRKERKDELRVLAEVTYKALCMRDSHEPTNKVVLESLKDFDDQNELKSVIQEIDWEGENIYWRDRRDNEKTTSFLAFYNRMIPIRKKHTN